MNELIKVTVNENSEPIVSCRDLYEKLELDKSQWSRWYKLNIIDNEFFIENVDYYTLDIMSNGNPTKDFAIKLDMAKELCMLCRNKKGKQARQYFIQVEKEWNSPDKVMARALLVADKTIKQLQLESAQKEQIISELKPKAEYLDRILQNTATMNINAIAKDYGMAAEGMNKLLHEFGVQYYQDNQWLLYSKYQKQGYTHSKTIEFMRKDGRADTRLHTKWTQKGRLFLYEFLKKQGVLPTIEKIYTVADKAVTA